MKEYKITKERLKAMAEECPEAEGILKKGFPEAFKEEEEWVDITMNITWTIDENSCGESGGVLHGYYDNRLLLTASSKRLDISPISIEDGTGRFKVKHDADRHTVLKRQGK